jgi:plastocyanin
MFGRRGWVPGPGAWLLLAALPGSLGPRPAAAPPRQGAGGRIEGVATIAKVLTKVHQRIRIYDDPGTPPPAAPQDDNPLANVVIYLESTGALRSATSPNPPQPAALRQRDETFVPHVLPVLVGTTVQFPNDDPDFHDVFSLSSAKKFDLQRYPQGSSRSQLFGKAGVVEVFCHIHADMSAYILVLDNPFFVIPDSQGHYALDGIPPGNYRLVAWYERSRPVVTSVHVEAGRTRVVPLRIPIPEALSQP